MNLDSVLTTLYAHDGSTIFCDVLEGPPSPIDHPALGLFEHVETVTLPGGKVERQYRPAS